MVKRGYSQGPRPRSLAVGIFEFLFLGMSRMHSVDIGPLVGSRGDDQFRMGKVCQQEVLPKVNDQRVARL